MVFIQNKELCGFIIPAIAFISSFGGAILAVSVKRTNEKISYRLMGLAGGIMLSLPYTELLPLAQHNVGNGLQTTALFASGIMAASLAEKAVSKSGGDEYSAGIMSSFAIALHNIPEGMASFVIGAVTPKLRAAYAAAILLHELPLGASAAAALFCTTKDKRKSLIITFAAALAQPVGALTAYFFLRECLTDILIGRLYAFMSGIIVYTALFELMPEGLKLKKTSAFLWISIGILIMPLLRLL